MQCCMRATKSLPFTILIFSLSCPRFSDSFNKIITSKFLQFCDEFSPHFQFFVAPCSNCFLNALLGSNSKWAAVFAHLCFLFLIYFSHSLPTVLETGLLKNYSLAIHLSKGLYVFTIIITLSCLDIKKHWHQRWHATVAHGMDLCLRQVPSAAEVAPCWTWVWAPCSLGRCSAIHRLRPWCLKYFWKGASSPAAEVGGHRTLPSPAAAGVWGWPWTGSEGRHRARLREEEKLPMFFTHTCYI